MNLTVALVVRIESAIALEALARCMPVWIAKTPANCQLGGSLAKVANPPALTWFPVRESETLEQAAVRISFSMDDHHNGYAQKEGYKFLLVFGAKYAASMAKELGELDFKAFEETDFGFVASK